MADPVVHITGGIPDSGTGNITTLGQTLLDGANLTLGITTDAAVTAGAAGTVNAHLRSISRDIVSGIVLQTGANVIGAVTQSGGPWSVSGTISATQSGTWTVQPGNTANTTPWLQTISQGGNAATVSAAGALKVDGSAATQPVSIAAAVTVAQPTAANLNATVTGTVTTAQATAANLKAQVDPLTAANWGIGASTQNSATVANGHLALGQFNTSPSAITTGNSSPLQLDGSGNLRVNIMAGGAAGGTSSTIGAAMPSVATVAMGSVTTAAPTYTTATANSLSLNTAGGLRVDGSGVTQPVSGTFWQATQPVSLASTTITGTVAVTQSTSPWVVSLASTTITGTVAATQSGAWTVNPTTIGVWGLSSSTFNTVTPTNGQLAEGQYISTQAAMTSGNSSPLQVDKVGRLLAVGALRTLKGVQKTSISTTTETTVVTAGAAGVFNDVYAIVVTNKSATAVFVDFRDATAGTVRMTLAAPAGDTRGFTVPVDSAMVQAAAASNWTATLSGAASSIEISMLYTSNL
jgi:hypothetical protein